LALMATLAASTAAHHGPGRLAIDHALTSGYQEAFAIAGVGLVIGALLALLLPVRTPGPERPDNGEPVRSLVGAEG
jgi:hypothetical protein